MRRIVFIVLFLLVCTSVNAEMWVCQQGDSLKRFIGDGYKAGICEKNNVNIISECIEATEQEYNNAGLQYRELDKLQPAGNRVVSWTQTKIDVYLQDQADAQEQAQLDAIDKYEISNIDLLTALVKVINARIPSNPITKQELISQIKADLGL